MDKKTAFIAGAIVGGIAGGIVALLFAPSSGKETRERLKSETEHLTKKVKDEALRISGKFRGGKNHDEQPAGGGEEAREATTS